MRQILQQGSSVLVIQNITGRCMNYLKINGDSDQLAQKYCQISIFLLDQCIGQCPKENLIFSSFFFLQACHSTDKHLELLQLFHFGTIMSSRSLKRMRLKRTFKTPRFSMLILLKYFPAQCSPTKKFRTRRKSFLQEKRRKLCINFTFEHGFLFLQKEVQTTSFFIIRRRTD